MQQEQQEPSAGGGRARLLFAVGLAGLLAVAAIVLVSSSGGEEHEFTAAPVRCLDSWNDDASAPSQLGVHQYDAHGYNRVQVLTVSPDGSAPVPETEPTALCAILFAAGSLDPEVSAAAFIRQGRAWMPMSGLQSPERLGEYQAQAQREYNAELQQDGTIEPL